MSPALCSIIIATRQRLVWLQQCLGSVLTQEGVNLEVIVVNDASIDQTAEWLDGFADPRLRALHFSVPGSAPRRATPVWRWPAASS